MSDAQIDAIRRMLSSSPVVKPGASLPEMRRGLDSLGDLAPRRADVTATKVKAGSVPGEWIEPRECDPERAVLYLHGGGYVGGSVQSHRVLIERLAVACRCRVLALNYRLAPEAPFPAALDDAVEAYRWLLGEEIPANQVAVAGDSAGGGLTLALLVTLRDAGDALPGCAVAISPWTDMEGTGLSMMTRAAVDPMVQRPVMQVLAGTYLQGANPKNPLASPLYADFKGLPPLLIQVGDSETLLDDSTRLEPRLKAAGVEATVEVWPDMIHVWHLFAPMLAEGERAIARIAEFVTGHTGA